MNQQKLEEPAYEITQAKNRLIVINSEEYPPIEKRPKTGWVTTLRGSGKGWKLEEIKTLRTQLEKVEAALEQVQQVEANLEASKEAEGTTAAKEYFSIAQAAEYTGFEESTIRRLVKSGKLKAVRSPHVRAIRIKRAELNKLFK